MMNTGDGNGVKKYGLGIGDPCAVGIDRHVREATTTRSISPPQTSVPLGHQADQSVFFICVPMYAYIYRKKISGVGR